MKKATALTLAFLLTLFLSACTTRPESTPTPSPDMDRLQPASSPEIDSPGEAPDPIADLCFLPVQVTGTSYIPQETEDEMGQEVLESYEYDENGRLVLYSTNSLTLTFQYLDQIALPQTLVLDGETTVQFMEPRWNQDFSQITLDIDYNGKVLPEDFTISEIQQDEFGKMIAGQVHWKSQLGEDSFHVTGYTFDQSGNLIFVPRVTPNYTQEYAYQYGDDNKVAVLEYGKNYGGEVQYLETIQVNEGGGPLTICREFGPADEYIHLGDGLYCSQWEDNWEEIQVDEHGNLIRYSRFDASSGVTCDYNVKYRPMSRQDYAGEAIDYSNLYPVIHIACQAQADSYAHAVGYLQLPPVAQVILYLW